MYSNDCPFHLFGTNNYMICYVTSLKTQPSYQIQRHLVLALTGNMSGLSTLTANRSFSAVTSNMTRLTTVTADGGIRALASNMSRLTAVMANSLILAITSKVTHLSTVTANNMISIARTSLASRTGTITSTVTQASTIVTSRLSLLSLSRL